MQQAQRVGRYVLETSLGADPAVELWLARQEGPGGFEKQVVLEWLSPRPGDGRELEELLLRGARRAATLSHPNVVQVFDVVEADGLRFVVREYVEGESLWAFAQRAAARGRALGPGFWTAVVAVSCAGLRHAHERAGLVHAGLSSRAVLMSADGIPKIAGFELAEARRSAFGRALAPHFATVPPEQARGEALDQRTDVYGLAATLFELMVGLPVVEEKDAAAMLGVKRNELPAGLAGLLCRALSSNPAQRPQTIAELEQTLLELTSVAEVSAAEMATAAREVYGPRPLIGASVEWPAAGAQDAEAPPGAGQLDQSGRLVAAAAKEAERPELVPERPATPFLDHAGSLELAFSPRAPVMPPALFVSSRRPLLGVLRRFGALAALLVVLGAAAYWLKPLLFGGGATPAPIKLTIETRPTGAEVWLDGFPLGKTTPVTLDYDNSLARQILLRKEGFGERRHTVPKGQPDGTLAIELPSVARVRVTSHPAGAEIQIEGRRVAVAPSTVEVLAGRRQTLRAVEAGYLDETTAVTLAAGEETRWSPVLRPAATLQVISDPEGAAVIIDKVAAGSAPIDVQVQANVTHRVVLRAAGLPTFQTEVALTQGEERTLSVTLEDPAQARMEASVASLSHQIKELRVELTALEEHPPVEYAPAMAALHRRNQIETQIDALESRVQELRGDIGAHRNELDDRVESR